MPYQENLYDVIEDFDKKFDASLFNEVRTFDKVIKCSSKPFVMMIFQKSKRKKCRGNIRVKLLMKSRMINRCKKNISIKDIY